MFFELRLEIHSEEMTLADVKAKLVELAQENLWMMSGSVIEIAWDTRRNRKKEVEIEYFEVE